MSELRRRVEGRLWPLLESFVASPDVAGLAVAVVRGEEVVGRGFGVRDVGTGAPVTSETMFHLASVSKPFVATAVGSLAVPQDSGELLLDLDAPIVEWVPEFSLSDGRAAELTARHLLSHTSGLPDVSDYGWHDPQLGDGALSDFARSLSGWKLQSEPGSTYSYSNAGFELLGLLLSRVTGTTFEDAVQRLVLIPLGMRRSTFLRADVPAELAAAPHVGRPLAVPGNAYPYTRRHAPSSTLHSNLDEMCHWLVAHLEPTELTDLLWQPVVEVGRPPWDEAAGLGWAVGSYRGNRTLGHSGMDPGFTSRFVLVPEQRMGVVALSNSNTVPTSYVTMAALDVVLDGLRGPAAAAATADEPGDGVARMRALRPSVVTPVAEELRTSGPDAAEAVFRRLAAADETAYDLDDEGFEDAVWGAIELHRTDLVWPLLRLWTTVRPDSTTAWTMTGWAQQVDGQPDVARTSLGRALDLDPDNDDAAQLMRSLPPE